MWMHEPIGGENWIYSILDEIFFSLNITMCMYYYSDVMKLQNGRIIMEVELTAEEGVAVLEAHRNMSGFDYFSMTPRDYHGSPLMFNHNPSVPKNSIDSKYVVYATAELFGVIFSQGLLDR